MPKLNFDLKKLYDANITDSIEKNLKDFNNYISIFTEDIDVKNFKPDSIENQYLFYFLFSFIRKAYFYILNHPNFFYTENTSNEFSKFF